jgi:hypothetical protein
MWNLGTESDVQLYIREAGEILGITKSLAPDKKDARHVIEHIIIQLIEFKRFNMVGLHCCLFTESTFFRTIWIHIVTLQMNILIFLIPQSIMITISRILMSTMIFERKRRVVKSVIENKKF